MKNTDAIRAQYIEHGFYIAEDLFTSEECQKIIDEGYTLNEEMNGGKAPIMMPHRSSYIFLDTLKEQKIREYLEVFIGRKLSGIQSQFFFSQPGTMGFSKHQDNFYVRAEADNFVSAWLALVDCNRYNGGLVIYPGSHTLGLLPVQETQHSNTYAQDPNANKIEAVMPEGFEPQYVEVQAGTMVFFSGHLVHESLNNNNDSDRLVLLNTYIKSGASFRPGQFAKRKEVPLN